MLEKTRLAQKAETVTGAASENHNYTSDWKSADSRRPVLRGSAIFHCIGASCNVGSSAQKSEFEGCLSQIGLTRGPGVEVFRLFVALFSSFLAAAVMLMLHGIPASSSQHCF